MPGVRFATIFCTKPEITLRHFEEKVVAMIRLHETRRGAIGQDALGICEEEELVGLISSFGVIQKAKSKKKKAADSKLTTIYNEHNVA